MLTLVDELREHYRECLLLLSNEQLLCAEDLSTSASSGTPTLLSSNHHIILASKLPHPSRYHVANRNNEYATAASPPPIFTSQSAPIFSNEPKQEVSWRITDDNDEQIAYLSVSVHIGNRIELIPTWLCCFPLLYILVSNGRITYRTKRTSEAC